MAQWCACELPLKALIALRRHFKTSCSCRSRRASLQHTTMWIDKSAKQMHADAIAARQTKIALESKRGTSTGGRDGGSAPAWNTGPRSARRLSHAATGLPVARVAAGGRECVEHFTGQWFCGAQHTKSARRRAGYPERLDAWRSRCGRWCPPRCQGRRRRSSC